MNLLDLPDEVLFMILEHVDLMTLLISVRPTSSCLRRITESILGRPAVRYNLVSLFHCAAMLTGLPDVQARSPISMPGLSIIWQDEGMQSQPINLIEETHHDWNLSKLALRSPLDKSFTGLHSAEHLSSIEFTSSTSHEVRTVEFAHIALALPTLSDCTSDSLDISLHGVLCTNAITGWRTQKMTELLFDLDSTKIPDKRFLTSSDILYTADIAPLACVSRPLESSYITLIIEPLESLIPSIRSFEDHAGKRLKLLCDWAVEELSLAEQDHDRSEELSDWRNLLSDIYADIQALREAWSALYGDVASVEETGSQTMPGITTSISQETAKCTDTQLGRHLSQAVYNLIGTVTWFCEWYPSADTRMIDYAARTNPIGGRNN